MKKALRKAGRTIAMKISTKSGGQKNEKRKTSDPADPDQDEELIQLVGANGHDETRESPGHDETRESPGHDETDTDLVMTKLAKELEEVGPDVFQNQYDFLDAERTRDRNLVVLPSGKRVARLVNVNQLNTHADEYTGTGGMGSVWHRISRDVVVLVRTDNAVDVGER